MLKIDLHVHTHNSKCGQHSLLEVLNIARDKGVRLIGITDHGPAQQGAAIRGTFFDPRRVPSKYGDVHILKGLEGNVANVEGATDLTPTQLRKLDIVLVGLHSVAMPNGGEEVNTQAIVNLLTRGPSIDMITHPDIAAYPLNMDTIVPLAAERGVILEINDANLALGKTDLARGRRMVELGQKHGALFAVNSDGHTWIEIGRDDHARQWLRELGSPTIEIVNDWKIDDVMARFAQRKQERLATLG